MDTPIARPPLTTIAASLPGNVPFVAPESIERQRGRAFRARLGANESSFGPSPKVVAALAASAAEVWKYGDPNSFELRTALATRLGVRPENIAVSEGIDALHGLIARLYLEPGDPVVTSLGAYPTFAYHINGFGGRLVTVPYADNHEDLAGLLDAVRREQPRLVYLCNPNNPMGTWWPAADVERFIAALPATTMLVLDEAYCETAPPGTLPALDATRPNILRLRTFSKAYGLAGLRCGYAIGDAQAVEAFDRVRNHFGVNRQAQVAALAALGDDAYLQAVVARTAEARDTIAAIAMANGLVPIPSAANFVAVDCGGDGAFALRVLQALAGRDVFVRKPMAPVLDRCIRISAGPPDQLAVLAAELPLALADAAR